VKVRPQPPSRSHRASHRPAARQSWLCVSPQWARPSALRAAQRAAAKSAEDKIAAICRQHIRFERIHPFSDGNGRVGRALVVYSCLQEKEAPIVIPVEERKRYMNVLNTEDLQGFVAFAKELQKEEEERLQVFLQKN